ncbi:MAG TPA: hypothetical protein CFH84_01015 [Sulfurimonas sp. UBA12504]|nr:MAG TPA: hypothetical protein CFH84_01015 [Sulfurimonas sp. UBA12504]
MIEEKYKSKINQLITVFKDAEKQLKHSEHDTNELSIPSINQLRYVAFHLVESFSSQDSSKIEEELNKAINHAQRAKYDAVEIGIVYYLEQIKIFQENYSSYTETLEILPNYIEYLTKAQNASDKLQTIKDDEKDREEYYKEVAPYYQILKDVYISFQTSIPLINKKIEENNEKARKENKRFVIGAGLTLAGIIVSIVIALIVG